MMMERKFRITKAKKDNSVQAYIGKTITMKEDGTILRPDIGASYDGKEFSMCKNDYNHVNEYYGIEEITEPRIELKCVGFEEGQPFKHKGYAGTYKIEDGELYTEGSNGWFYAGYMKIIHVLRDIELIPQPTEEDKQIAELKETIEEAMRKIEEIEKARK